MSWIRSGFGRWSVMRPFPVKSGGRVEVGRGAGAGGLAPAASGAVAGGVEFVVVEGDGGAPVGGAGAAARGGGGGAFGASTFGGAFVPPGVVQVADRVAQVRADERGVAADEPLDGFFANAQGAGDAGRAVAHHVQGTQAQPGSACIDASTRPGGARHRED